MKTEEQRLTPEQRASLLEILKTRFEKNMDRHAGLGWQEVEEKLADDPEKLWSLSEMERTGGEPDVIASGERMDGFVFVDCSAESPAGRRNLCYDRSAREGRKENRPESSAIELADAMGIEILTEAQYRALQDHGKFDTKTSSWVRTPEAIRRLGGALFCDRRYDAVFVYHNGAESYYAVRGFRGSLRIGSTDGQNETIDAYIADQPAHVRPLLESIRRTLRAALPEAEERIAWRMPTYWKGQNIIHFAAFRNHLGIYPGDQAMTHFSDQLREYKTSKGALQLPFDRPLPLELIAQIARWCYETGNHH